MPSPTSASGREPRNSSLGFLFYVHHSSSIRRLSRMKTPSIVGVIGAGLMFAATTSADPYNPAERAIGGGLLGAGTGAAIGAIAGGGRGAAVGAAVGGGVGAAVGAATTPPPPRHRHYRHTARRYYY